MLRIIFAGTPDFAVPALDALLSTPNQDHHVVAVFTQPDRKSGRGKKLTASPVKLKAAAHNIPIHQPTSLKDQADAITRLQPDLIVVVAYGMLLPPAILGIPRLGCLNIHASLLPRWRGAAPIQRAIETGDLETGVCLMKMEADLDTGPIYSTLTTPIHDADTSLTLHNRLAELGAQGLLDTLERLQKDPNWEPTPQPESGITYAKKITKDEGQLDWSLSAHQIHCKIRAFLPWPICQTEHQRNRIRLWQAELTHEGTTEQPGKIIALSDQGIDVATGEGVLRVTQLQRDGGKALDWVEFRNGYPLAMGDRLT